MFFRLTDNLKPDAGPINSPPSGPSQPTTLAATRQPISGGPAQLMEQHTCIQDLPIELLLYIFRLSFDIINLQQDRCRLSLACHSWRDLVQESAYLWTEISAHDDIHYIARALAKSKDLPIDIYYIWSDGPSKWPRAALASYIGEIIPLLSRTRSISLITSSASAPVLFTPLLTELQETPTPFLGSLILKGAAAHRKAGHNPRPPQLLDMGAFPKLRRLEIDGVSCKLSSRALQLHNILSLNLVDVVDVSAEQLLEVLRNSPYLESLELGRSPVACPAHSALTPIHLPYLTTLHLIFMPSPVSNFFLSALNAPSCSELSVSSHFPPLRDDVGDRLFTSSTDHFTPILRTLLACGRHKDFYITSAGTGEMLFALRFHDGDRDYPASRAILRLDFRLNSVRQIEETVHWLGDYLPLDLPEISIRLRIDRFEDVHIMNLLESYTTITHLSFRAAPYAPKPNKSNSILFHMAQPTQLRWPLPNLEVFVYRAAPGAESHDRAMLDMLRRRYTSSSEGPDNEQIRPRPIKRVHVEFDTWRCDYILGEVRKILPEVETSIVSSGTTFW